MGLALEAKQPDWWKQYADAGHIQYVPYLGLEGDATAITSFAAFYMTAMLQTADYAEAIIKGIAPKMTRDVLKDRVELRLRRQQWLEEDNPPRYRVLIDEAVLHRPTGGPAVMAAQIDKILRLSEEGKVAAQIVPFDIGVLASRDSNFVMLEFREAELSSIVFVESLRNSLILEKAEDVARHREAIESLRNSALTPEETGIRLNQWRETYEGDNR